MEGERASERSCLLWVMNCAMGVFYHGISFYFYFKGYVSTCTEGYRMVYEMHDKDLCYNDGRRLANVMLLNRRIINRVFSTSYLLGSIGVSLFNPTSSFIISIPNTPGRNIATPPSPPSPPTPVPNLGEFPPPYPYE